MSSKSGSSHSERAAGNSPRRLSLTLWLTISNTLSAFLILSLIALILYFGLAAQLKHQNHLYLHDEVNLLESMIRSQGVSNALSDETEVDQHGEEYLKHYIRLLNKRELVLVETAGMAAVAPRIRFKTPLRDGLPGLDNLWENPDGGRMLGTAVWVDLGKTSGEQGILEVALDVTNVHKILVGYRHKIYWSLAFGFLLCFTVSLLIAYRGTHPLRELIAVVCGITVKNLGERISGSQWPGELRTLAEATNQMLARLDDSFTRLYTSANNLSHKIRTPLTILRGEAEVALSRERSAEELRDVIASSLEENQRLQRLIDNILFLANADIGKCKAVHNLLDAREELDKVVDFYIPLAEDKGITLSCQGDAQITADPALFRKMAAALISNGITYNQEGGKVELVLRQLTGQGGALSVKDSGCGIPADELEKIFDRFYRIYTTRYMDPHGTGLGLPIARAVMELHNGSITVHSVPGQGTTVTVTFPPSAA